MLHPGARVGGHGAGGGPCGGAEWPEGRNRGLGRRDGLGAEWGLKSGGSSRDPGARGGLGGPAPRVQRAGRRARGGVAEPGLCTEGHEAGWGAGGEESLPWPLPRSSAPAPPARACPYPDPTPVC